jgi:hypothetical protein
MLRIYERKFIDIQIDENLKKISSQQRKKRKKKNNFESFELKIRKSKNLLFKLRKMKEEEILFEEKLFKQVFKHYKEISVFIHE